MTEIHVKTFLIDRAENQASKSLVQKPTGDI